MSKDPAFLMYSKDWVSGTADMMPDEKGVYIDLLCLQHLGDGLPTDTRRLAKMVGISHDDFLRIWKIVGGKFSRENGKFFNKRMKKEVEKRRQFSEYQRKKANKRWENKEPEGSPGNAPAMPGDMPGDMPEACIRIENGNVNVNVSADVDENANRGESAERGGKRQSPGTTRKTQFEIQDFIDQVVDEFVAATEGEYIVVSRGKERGAAGKLVNIFKKIFPDAGTRELLDQLRDYFARCVTIEDPWLRDNMSLSIIISKFNEINKILKNGRSKQGRGATPDEIIGAVSKYFPIEGYPGRG